MRGMFHLRGSYVVYLDLHLTSRDTKFSLELEHSFALAPTGETPRSRGLDQGLLAAHAVAAFATVEA